MIKALLVLACCMQVGISAAQLRNSAKTKARPLNEMRISLKSKGQPLYDVLTALPLNAKGIVISDECRTCSKPVCCDLDNVTLDSALKVIFIGQPWTFEWLEGYPVIYKRSIKGHLTDENGRGMEAVLVESGGQSTYTDQHGFFELPKAACNATIQFSNRYIETQSETVRERTWMEVTVKLKWSALGEREISNDGIQKRTKERAPGVIAIIPELQYRRAVSSDPVAPLEAQVSGVLFNRNILSWKNQPDIDIRGSGTIHSANGPLIILNDFPISIEDFRRINPNDIKSITILKDALATSVWGARAGNGVIVITTHTGKYNTPLQFSASHSVSMTDRPDLEYMPMLTSSEYIDMEKARYATGIYGPYWAQPSALLSPVAEALFGADKGIITPDQRDALFKQWSSIDVRRDLHKWVYRKAFTHRHHLTASGGGDNFNYYLTGGYDGEQLPMQTANKKRITSNGVLQLKRKRFELSMNTYYSYSVTQNNMPAPGVLYPFARLKDDEGNDAVVYADRRQGWKDSMAQFMQDWSNRPLEDLKQRSLTEKATMYRMSITGSYALSKNFSIKIIYQNDHSRMEKNDVATARSYYARNLVNSYATVLNGSVNYNIPKGGISNWLLSDFRSNRIRGQVNYGGKWRNWLEVTALAGAESSSTRIDSMAGTFFDFDGDRRVVPVSATDEFRMSYDTTQRARIPRADNNSSAYDYFASFYTNGAFIIKKRYTFSFSARMDRSNLFGANTNGNSKPLGSVGFKWDLHEEPIYRLRTIIPFLSLRTSYGSSGNISKNTTAYVSAMASQMAQGTLYSIISPANPDLRWEESRMFNAGISLNDYNRHYFFDFDYYIRRSYDLMGPGAQDATYGLDAKWGNYASLKGQGWDLSFKTMHDINKFKMENLLLLSRSVNTVRSYYNASKDAGYFVNNTYLRPREGYPVNSIYAFKWVGLDPANGDPRGYQKGSATTQYQDIFNAPADSLVFKGSATPTLWGTLRPSIARGNWKISVTLTGKFGYVFRRSSVNYFDPYNNRIAGRNDFSRRWTPDNTNTEVPSFKLTPNGERDFFYNYSEILVERGDHIRLQDVRFDYDFSSHFKKWKIKNVTAYAYASNLWLLWSANKLGIDPDSQYGPPPGKSVTIGFTVDF